MSTETTAKSPMRTPIKSPHFKDQESTKRALLRKEHELNKQEIMNMKEENLKYEAKASELKKNKSSLTHAIRNEQNFASIREKEFRDELETQILLERQKMNFQISDVRNKKDQERQSTINNYHQQLDDLRAHIKETMNDVSLYKPQNTEEIDNSKIKFHGMIVNWNSIRQLSDYEKLNLKLRKTLNSIRQNLNFNVPPKPKLAIEVTNSFETAHDFVPQTEERQVSVNYTKIIVQKPILLVSQ